METLETIEELLEEYKWQAYRYIQRFDRHAFRRLVQRYGNYLLAIGCRRNRVIVLLSEKSAEAAFEIEDTRGEHFAFVMEVLPRYLDTFK